MKELRYFSMFSGIGGFELGLQNMGVKPQDSTHTEGGTPQHSISPLCVGYSEIDKYAIKVYERHFDHTNYGDATTINATELPDFDLLVGGFPCQAFSVAGKRRGFDDTRGTLFFEIARILADKRPRHLVLENVKGLLSHDSGKTFQTILGVLSDLGYRVEWQVLNSKDFGVPQNRERIYIVGHFGGECSGEVLPITGTNGKDTRVIGQDVAYTIDANYHKGTNTLEKSRRSLIEVSARHENRVYEDIAPTVQSSYGTGGGHVPFVTGAPRIRRLTPLECERLQGFPDNWTAEGRNRTLCNSSCEQDHIHGIEPISDTQRYKMCGNAVTVNVVAAVITNLLNHLED
jgi:DNA (cytosine-5)-methyltransferase 1